jgi:Rrf2 family protein
MRVSTKGRYALRLMLELAKHPNQCISIREISEKQNISHKYLEQIIIQLVRAGHVKSIRGPQGGYSLSSPPEKITAGMILRTMEGSLSPVACLDDDEDSCERTGECETLSLWKNIQQAINQIVDTTTLQDLLDQSQNNHIGMWL